jgi:hypothetical protein
MKVKFHTFKTSDYVKVSDQINALTILPQSPFDRRLLEPQTMAKNRTPSSFRNHILPVTTNFTD